MKGGKMPPRGSSPYRLLGEGEPRLVDDVALTALVNNVMRTRCFHDESTRTVHRHFLAARHDVGTGFTLQAKGFLSCFRQL